MSDKLLWTDNPAPGYKYRLSNGVRAVYGGQRPSDYSSVAPQKKPPWLRKRLSSNVETAGKVRAMLRSATLHTVCEEARCPNLPECFSRGTATFMLLGSVCTRACRFCHVSTGNPRGLVDKGEPQRVATAVADMKLNYVVLTSVNRDDLPDGGAGIFAATVEAIHALCPQTGIEVLVPDFAGDLQALQLVVQSPIRVIAQNIETVRRLTYLVRDPRASYDQTLHVLEQAQRMAPKVLTKSSLLLGLGETADEVHQTMLDLRSAGVSLLTLGQYLRPTIHHLPVADWITPKEFANYHSMALQAGFKHVVAEPISRSSYKAEQSLGVELNSMASCSA